MGHPALGPIAAVLAPAFPRRRLLTPSLPARCHKEELSREGGPTGPASHQAMGTLYGYLLIACVVGSAQWEITTVAGESNHTKIYEMHAAVEQQVGNASHVRGSTWEDSQTAPIGHEMQAETAHPWDDGRLMNRDGHKHGLCLQRTDASILTPITPDGQVLVLDQCLLVCAGLLIYRRWTITRRRRSSSSRRQPPEEAPELPPLKWRDHHSMASGRTCRDIQTCRGDGNCYWRGVGQKRWRRIKMMVGNFYMENPGRSQALPVGAPRATPGSPEGKVEQQHYSTLHSIASRCGHSYPRADQWVQELAVSGNRTSAWWRCAHPPTSFWKSPL